jgi:coproporphyrinogen III oxidase-like Fe-S oxidoreductase
LIERYAEQLKELAEEGFLEYDDENIRLHRRGLLCVDNLLFKFFLPEHVTSRIV